MNPRTLNGINFDGNATLGMDGEVLAELQRELISYGNPSSIHQGGQKARAKIEEARSEIGLLLNLHRGDRIIFTSGATEANNLAVYSRFSGLPKGANLIISSVEHAAIREPAYRLVDRGVEVREVAPRADGMIHVEDVLGQIDSDSWFLSIMQAHNETGTIFPIDRYAAAAKAKVPYLTAHADSVQALGKLPIDFQTLEVDLMSISAHKIGGLAGVGALVVREGSSVTPMIIGGPQEVRYRSGTENVFGIISFGIAARYARINLEKRIARMQALKDSFIRLLAEGCQNCSVDFAVQFDQSPTLANTISVRFPGILASELVVHLDLNGVWTSAGAACSSGKPLPSEGLLGFGISEQEARETLRVSFSPALRYEELASGVETFLECLSSLSPRVTVSVEAHP